MARTFSLVPFVVFSSPFDYLYLYLHLFHSLISLLPFLPPFAPFQVARSETGWAQISKSREEYVREHLDNLYHKITSLTPNSYYRIEMNAHNAIGSSETSFLVIQTPSDLNSLASHKSASASSFILSSSLVLLLATTIALLLSPSTS